MTSDLSAEDVKDKLFHSLKSRGVLDSLKSQLRKQLIWELQDTTGLPVLQSKVKALTKKKEGGGQLFQRVANSIVAEYLKQSHFEYTLSTFLPESGVSLDKMFSNKDILQLLNINPESKLYTNLVQSLSSATDSKGFLCHFLIEVAAFQNNTKRDAYMQTEDQHELPTRLLSSLEEKLSSVEKEYSEKQKLFTLDKNQGLEEKLITMQKKYEMQKKQELEEEVKKFKASELSRLRMDERQKYEVEIKKMRLEFDEEFNIKNQALRALEREMLDRLQRLQEAHQSEAYGERQKLLEEMRSFKEREADFKNRTLLQERSQKLEQERLSNEVEKLKDRDDALKEKEKLQAQRLKTEVENFKSDYERQHSARNQELLRQETLLEAERSKLSGGKEEYLRCHDELATFKDKCFHLQSSVEASKLLLEDMKAQKQALEQKLAEMKDYHTLKEKEIILTKDIQHLTQRLTETNLHCKEQEKRHHKLVKDLAEKTGKPSKEVVILKQELKNATEKCKENEKYFYEARNTMEIQLEAEIQRANHFQKICEEQLNSQRLLETEIENLKMMQEQTERLLSMELRHQNASSLNTSTTSRKKIATPKTINRRKTRLDVSSRGPASISTRVPREKQYDAEDSSTMDESSLASITEDKRSLERFEREAAALDVSYQDFQSRIVPPKYSVASMPSSMSFRRLASYHSLHSPPSATNVASGGFSLATADSKNEFRPLKQIYDEADTTNRARESASIQHITPCASARITEKTTVENRADVLDEKSPEQSDLEVESGRLGEDENVALTVKDLNPIHVPPNNFTNQQTTANTENSSPTCLAQPIKMHRMVDKPSKPGNNVKPSRYLFREGQIISGKKKLEENNSAVDDHDDVFAGHASPAFDSTNGIIDQTENLMAERDVNLHENVQESMSGGTTKYSVSNGSLNIRTGFDASSITAEHSKERIQDITEKRKEDNLTKAEEIRSRKSSASSEKSISLVSLQDNLHTYTKSSYSEEKEEENMSDMAEQSDLGMSKVDKRRHSTELDMEELEERRRRDTERHPEQVENYRKKETNSKMSPDDDDGGSESEVISEVNRSRESHDATNSEQDNQNNEQDPPIDPVMLKYMEMIKQRREVENDKSEEKPVNVSSKVDSHDISEQESRVSLANEEDLSMGKLSDVDFDW